MSDPKKAKRAKQIRSLTEELVRKGLGIIDPIMRANYVAEKLAVYDEETIVHILRLIFIRASRRIHGYREFLEGGINVDKIKDKIGKFKFSRLYHLARNNKFQDIVTLFSLSPPERTAKSDEEMFLVYGEADQTVGERRFHARSTDNTTLDKVGYDVNPLVIKQLLKNPRMTEANVMKIAARRPNYPDVIKEIFDNKKWISRYDIKLAIASNPYSPPNMCLSLLPFLMIKDLKRLCIDGKINQQVRKEADRLLAGKKKSKDAYLTDKEQKPKKVFQLEEGTEEN